jgi:hypothetical protein
VQRSDTAVDSNVDPRTGREEPTYEVQRVAAAAGAAAAAAVAATAAAAGWVQQGWNSEVQRGVALSIPA